MWTREELGALAVRAREWAAAAAGRGRGKDAADLGLVAELAEDALVTLGTRDRLVRFNSDDEAREAASAEFKAAALFGRAVQAGGWDCGAECCPFSKDAVCGVCRWFRKQWVMGGRRYQCLTAWSCRSHLQTAGQRKSYGYEEVS